MVDSDISKALHSTLLDHHKSVHCFSSCHLCVVLYCIELCIALLLRAFTKKLQSQQEHQYELIPKVHTVNPFSPKAVCEFRQLRQLQLTKIRQFM